MYQLAIGLNQSNGRIKICQRQIISASYGTNTGDASHLKLPKRTFDGASQNSVSLRCSLICYSNIGLMVEIEKAFSYIYRLKAYWQMQLRNGQAPHRLAVEKKRMFRFTNLAPVRLVRRRLRRLSTLGKWRSMP